MRWDNMKSRWIRDYVQYHDVMRWFDEYEKYHRHIDSPNVEAKWVLDAFSGDFRCTPTIISEVVVPESENEQSDLPPLEDIL